MRISDWSSDVCSSDLVVREIGAIKGKAAVFRFFGNSLDIVGLALRAPVIGHGADFVVGNKRAVNPGNLFPTRHIKHVALAQKLFRALFTQDGATVDFLRNIDADTRWPVGLDVAGSWEELRVGTQCVRSCRSLWLRYHKKNKKHLIHST